MGTKILAFLGNLAIVLLIALGVSAWAMAPWPLLAVMGVAFVLWMALTRTGRQAGSVTMVGVSTLGRRVGASSVVVIGIAGVVAVLVAMLAMADGYQGSLRRSGSPDTAIVLRGSSDSEVSSVLGHDAVVVIEQAVGIARDAAGKPIASPELAVAANLQLKGSADTGSVQLRGVGEQAWTARPGLQIVAGRRFQPGLRELVVGQGAQDKFAGLELGHEVKLGAQMWKIVGIFRAGNAFDSEIWADADVVASAYRRGSSRTSVLVRLTSPAAFKTFAASLAADPRLQVDATTTADYYAKQSQTMTKVIRIIGIVVGLIMAIGAMFGALNTMFAAVAARAREIATLRAIGFGGLPVVVAVMLETMLLALFGGLLGGGVAWVLFNGYTASTLAGGIGQLTFQFEVSPRLMWTGIQWALAIGFIGGLYPALRAARMQVTDALRAA
ncbi:MAG: ABC transporter permease [Proteobacteria bacterium]|nr:ABC transporter permease [Pseudomonadota bacterium]